MRPAVRAVAVRDTRLRQATFAALCLVVAAVLLAACSTPRFDMVGEEATGDPVANKAIGTDVETRRP